MSALEQEILEKFRQLDGATRDHVLEVLQHESDSLTTADERAWLDRATQFRLSLREKYGFHHFGSIQDLLDEVREERLNDLMDRY
jgi:hypothetical protein